MIGLKYRQGDRFEVCFESLTERPLLFWKRYFWEVEMRKFGLILGTIFAGLFVLAFAAPAQAQATRTWVSGVGDDANPCSRTAPCKTFAGAISKTAAGGEISVLDPGGFGAVTITKAITLNGDGTLASILVSGTNAIIINAGASDTVIIRNLSFEGMNTGLAAVRVLAAGKVVVENCAIYGFAGNSLEVNSSTATSMDVRNTSITG